MRGDTFLPRGFFHVPFSSLPLPSLELEESKGGTGGTVAEDPPGDRLGERGTTERDPAGGDLGEDGWEDDSSPDSDRDGDGAGSLLESEVKNIIEGGEGRAREWK